MAELRRERDPDLVRVRLLTLLMMAALLVLGASLWRIQVSHGWRYEDSFQRQTERRVRMPALRGRILDRNGVCLADNRPSYNVVLRLDQLRRQGGMRGKALVDIAQASLGSLAVLIGRDVPLEEHAIRIHVQKRLPMSLVAWRDVDPAVMARLAEQGPEGTAVGIEMDAVRHYPQGRLAAHVLGYVGRSIPPWADTDYTLPETVGKRGIELRYNSWLAGRPGEQVIHVDASGFRRSTEEELDAKPGGDLVLTLDARIQAAAEKALEGQTGAVVVLDVTTGDVLAMASMPSFDPNGFVPAIPSNTWTALIADPGRPMINRATRLTYAPGSIFKPLVALAALESRAISPETEFACPGYFALGAVRFRCWNPNGHGALALRKGLEQSCNSYFCAAGLQCGWEAIRRQADAVGLGRKTGIDLDLEVPGLLPDEAWKRKFLQDGWRPGDTCNLSIGQGFLSVTPLQMAVMLAAIANGGQVHRPRLVLGVRPPQEGTTRVIPVEAPRTIGWSDRTLNAVRSGMHDVVQAPTGTGSRARLRHVEMGGKTGTAEWGPKEGGGRHAWMGVFAPYDRPRYAAVIVLDSAESGGRSAGPRMHTLMAAVFGEPEGEG